jgi:hypothetical protein
MILSMKEVMKRIIVLLQDNANHGGKYNKGAQVLVSCTNLANSIAFLGQSSFADARSAYSQVKSSTPVSNVCNLFQRYNFRLFVRRSCAFNFEVTIFCGLGAWNTHTALFEWRNWKYCV